MGHGVTPIYGTTGRAITSSGRYVLAFGGGKCKKILAIFEGPR
jgi:hypothetical protein